MRRARFTIAIVLVLVAGAARAKEGPQAACDMSALPRDISEVVNSRFVGWRIKTTADLEPYDRRLWIEGKGDACPGITSGHFVSWKKLTFAVLLVPDSPHRKGYKVVVFANLSKPTIVQDEQNPGGADPVIYRLPPGSYSDADGARTIRVRTDVLQVEKMEVSTTIYFWRDGHTGHLVTSD